MPYPIMDGVPSAQGKEPDRAKNPFSVRCVTANRTAIVEVLKCIHLRLNSKIDPGKSFFFFCLTVILNLAKLEKRFQKKSMTLQKHSKEQLYGRFNTKEATCILKLPDALLPN